MSIPKYPTYKESGVQWLGEFPSHWQMKRFKQVFQEREERSSHGEEMLLSVSAYTGVSPRADVIEEGDHLSRAESLEGYKVCYKGDLVMNIMLAWNRGLAFTDYDGIVSPAYCVFTAKDGSSTKFLNYLVRSNEYTFYFKAFSAGVIDSRLRMYPDTFGALFCCLPSVSEQAAIAEFLDCEVAKISALVAEQQQLMTLLKEKRQSLITQAVTKGLDPRAPMKDSGIEWLGEVPAHWGVRMLKRALRSSDYGISDALESDGEIAVLRMGNIQEGKIATDDLKYTKCVDPSLLLRRGDLLYNRTNSLDLIGKVGMYTGNLDFALSFASYLVRLRIVEGSMPEYFAYLLNTTGILGLARSSAFIAIGQCNLNPARYAQIEVPIPPEEEQRSIVAYLDAQTNKLDSLIMESERAIDLLQERCAALISAGVTGKIDVSTFRATRGAI